MAKAKQSGPDLIVRDLSTDERGRIVAAAARLAAASGQDAMEVAVRFAGFVAAPNGDLVALEAAVTEAADRHDHLRGRNPANVETVLARAEQFAGFIAGVQ